MNDQNIQDIVSAVLKQLGETEVSASTVKRVVTDESSTPVNSDGSLPDLGDDEFKNWNGVVNAQEPKIIEDLITQTAARVGNGCAGPRPRTTALMRFWADHSRSKDTVIKNISEEWLKEHNLLEVKSQAQDKDEYLTRPDLGRKLCPDARDVIAKNFDKSPQVQVVLSDGLSMDAITSNLDEILPPLMNGIKNAGLRTNAPFFLRYGRVKAQDEIGELLDAEVNILLIGERPGLGQSESLSCYAVYKPNQDTVESDRTVISNIHSGGTPPVEAAAVIVDLIKTMLAQKASGINLKR
ncbi:ethanolamine ammonia-lyase light chain [Vibrio sp. MACH09]|uniref:ethanolamine ammonia-lyase subunit EutC n=1 Tax=unclassified Vibrio TaxID=2614977 RepID=UPI00149332FE|nr:MULTISPECIES: ethanolamine ammonia-lyase subunit EutC [unclassified Vibrio]NOI67615.1 ethanolamine ammonia-lyase subunit EutC [Vibrio sp. 99-8-1]GLO61250.1 ethanolamine ammonia-lyase light chain [Vibrio sp. MACH09]